MIIGSVFTVVAGLCLFMAALTQPPGGKISMFWPLMFELTNSIGFAHVLPISLALFSKISPRQITATVIGLVVLAQVPTLRDLLGIGLVVAGVALHRP
jgi:POT family proton-dependent oligopeptide transporter